MQLLLLLSLTAAEGAKREECEEKLRQVDEAVANISIALAKDARPFESLDDFSLRYCRYALSSRS